MNDVVRDCVIHGLVFIQFVLEKSTLFVSVNMLYMEWNQIFLVLYMQIFIGMYMQLSFTVVRRYFVMFLVTKAHSVFLQCLDCSKHREWIIAYNEVIFIPTPPPPTPPHVIGGNNEWFTNYVSNVRSEICITRIVFLLYLIGPVYW